MSRQRSIRQYIQALYAAAGEMQQVHETEKRLNVILGIYKNTPKFKQLLFTKRVTPEAKLKIIESVLTGYLTDLETDLFRLLVRDELLDKLVDIIHGYIRLARRDPSVVDITIFTTEVLDAKKQEELTRRLSEIFKKQVFTKSVKDETLIGGARLRVGNTIVDGSIARRLEKLRDSLIRT